MLLQTSGESEARTFTIVGVAFMLCVVGVSGLLIVFNPFGGQAADRISIVIDTPYVGLGVTKGTAVVLDGVQVGDITAVSSLPRGGVRLNANLQKTPVAGLTDAMQIDFRPANYFGVTGINLTPGSGGQALYDGIRIRTVPKGNFTLQTMLSRLGQLSSGALTPQAIQAIDKATQYIDGFDPLIETLLMIANAVAQVQTVPTAQLLANATGTGVVLPSFLNGLTNFVDDLLHGDTNYLHKGFADNTEYEFQHKVIPTFEVSSNGVFASAGKLEESHVADLLPFLNGVKSITDVIPPLLRPVGVGDMLVELRSRFENLYAGIPGQRALQVRIVLDSLPGLAAALGVGGP